MEGHQGSFFNKCQVELTENGWIKTDEFFRTSIDNVYAIGDCLGPTRPMLAHVAMHEAICCIENIFGGKKKMDYDRVPGVVYTNPEIGCVGITEEMAKEQGFDFDISQVMFRAIGRSHTSGEISGDAKIVFDKKIKKNFRNTHNWATCIRTNWCGVCFTAKRGFDR